MRLSFLRAAGRAGRWHGPHSGPYALLCVVLFRTAVAVAGEAASRPVDPRWRDLPHTDTVFVPRHFATLDEWQAWRDHLRRQILWAAGLMPMPEKTPLNAHVFGRIERDGYSVEKAYFESYPGFLVTGNLYRPLTPGRHPGVACPHGHWKNGRLQDDDVGSIPARCITLARMGCVVFAYDMVGYNDSGMQIANHRFTSERGELWGFGGPLGLQLWNSIRVIDFLQSLLDVDAERIGCTGASGGGTQTFLLCAVDDRLKVAAPVNMISSTMQGGCVCENAPCLRIDTNNMEIGAMMAPRPLFMVSATGDWTKNTPKVEYPAIREIYSLYGAEDRVGMIQIDAGHNYNRASREAVYRWVGKGLLGRNDMDTFTEPPYQKERDADLLVFADRPLPYNAVPNLETLLEWRIGAAKRQLTEFRPADAAAWQSSRELLSGAIRLAVGAAGPGLRADVGVEPGDEGPDDTDCVRRGRFVDRSRGTRVPFIRFLPEKPDGRAAAGHVLLIDGRGKAACLAADARGPGVLASRLLAAGSGVTAIDVFGLGEATGEPDPKAPRGSTKFFTTFNRTDVAERVYDIVTAARGCRNAGKAKQAGSAPGGELGIVGLGEAGPWCVLACALLATSSDGRAIRAVIDANGFDTGREESYRKNLYVPGILRAGGLPAAAALIPPARLFLHNTGDRFDTSWLKDVERLLPAARVVIQKSKASDDVVAKWLAEP